MVEKHAKGGQQGGEATRRQAAPASLAGRGRCAGAGFAISAIQGGNDRGCRSLKLYDDHTRAVARSGSRAPAGLCGSTPRTMGCFRPTTNTRTQRPSPRTTPTGTHESRCRRRGAVSRGAPRRFRTGRRRRVASRPDRQSNATAAPCCGVSDPVANGVPRRSGFNAYHSLSIERGHLQATVATARGPRGLVPPGWHPPVLPRFGSRCAPGSRTRDTGFRSGREPPSVRRRSPCRGKRRGLRPSRSVHSPGTSTVAA